MTPGEFPYDYDGEPGGHEAAGYEDEVDCRPVREQTHGISRHDGKQEQGTAIAAR